MSFNKSENESFAVILRCKHHNIDISEEKGEGCAAQDFVEE